MHTPIVWLRFGDRVEGKWISLSTRSGVPRALVCVATEVAVSHKLYALIYMSQIHDIPLVKVMFTH